MQKNASKKTAPKKSASSRRFSGNASNVKRSGSRIQVGSERTAQSSNVTMFKIVEGIPLARVKANDDEVKGIVYNLSLLIANKNHFLVPSRLKSATLRLAKINFPSYKMRTSFNRSKGTVSIWRIA